MSFQPVTRWELRCDGRTSRGQCPTRWIFSDDPDDPDGVWALALFERPELAESDQMALRASGWLMTRDGRVLCARHVAALEYQAHAALDGLPFDEVDR